MSSLQLPSCMPSLCHPCQQAKSKKPPFVSSSSCSSKPFQVLFMDVWGPSPILSNDGYRFYLLTVDDFTRYTWLFSLQQRSQVFDTFVHFKSIVQNMFSTKIIPVQTDEGKEFVNRRFCTLFSMNGIQHRLSCPYTPEHMVLVEQKHRHVVETGLALLATSSRPKTFWVEAFQTTVYLINSMPTKVLIISLLLNASQVVLLTIHFLRFLVVRAIPI